MREITASGQTVEEAIESALVQLDIDKEQADIEVIDEGKKGFLGLFGSALAIVKVTEKPQEDMVKATEDFLVDVASKMDIDIQVETIVEDNQITYELSGEKIGMLIGKRGKTLNALQYLTQLVLNKDTDDYHTVIVDAEGYRGRREDTLKDLAQKMRDKALRLDTKVSLEPMPAYERKIIHSALQDTDDVETYSDGREPHRHIVIEPK